MALPDRNDIKEEILLRFGSALHDLEKTSRGQMSFYSLSKNLRIQVLDRLRIQKGDYIRFQEQANELKTTVALLISVHEVIPFRTVVVESPTTSSPLLMFFIHIDDLTPRFVDMIAALPNISAEDIEYHRFENMKLKPSSSSRPPQPSELDLYTRDKSGFDAYCLKTCKTRIEYDRAKHKWPDLMSKFKNKTEFIAFVESLKPSVRSESNGTIEEFHEYILNTSISAITKAYIRAKFSNLEPSKTFVNEPFQSFRNKLRELKTSLRAQSSASVESSS